MQFNILNPVYGIQSIDIGGQLWLKVSIREKTLNRFSCSNLQIPYPSLRVKQEEERGNQKTSEEYLHVVR
jgi:hypothetical protein